MIKRCAYGRCFTTDGSDPNCECGKAPAKASPATPLSRIQPDEPVLTIIDPPSLASRMRDQLGAAENHYRQSAKQDDAVYEAVRRLNRIMPVNMLGGLVLPGLPLGNNLIAR